MKLFNNHIILLHSITYYPYIVYIIINMLSKFRFVYKVKNSKKFIENLPSDSEGAAEMRRNLKQFSIILRFQHNTSIIY